MGSSHQQRRSWVGAGESEGLMGRGWADSPLMGAASSDVRSEFLC